MLDLMPPSGLMWAFAAAAVVLALTPGPGVVYVVTRTLAQGRWVGLVSIAAVAVGNLGNAVAAAVGLAALMAVSDWAFTLVKLLGAAYLVYLGVRLLISPAVPDGAANSQPPSRSHVFRDGVWVALFNPKTTLFFAAFTPQFVSDPALAVPQSLLLGALFVLIAMVTDALYVLAAAELAPWLRKAAWVGKGRIVSAWVFIALGVWAALAGRGAQPKT